MVCSDAFAPEDARVLNFMDFLILLSRDLDNVVFFNAAIPEVDGQS